MGKRDLTEAQAIRVMARLRQRLEREHQGNVLGLARDLKTVTQPALWKLLNDRAKPSLATVRALADAEGVTVEAIMSTARERAAAVAKEAKIPDDAIRRVLAEPEPEEQQSILWWIDRMRATALLSGSPVSTPSPAAPTGTPALGTPAVTPRLRRS